MSGIALGRFEPAVLPIHPAGDIDEGAVGPNDPDQ